MRSVLLLAGGFMAAAILTGCGPEKQLPDAVTVDSTTGPDTGPQIPATSHEEAKKLVARYLQAASGGDPARLAKLRVSRMVCSGNMKRADEKNNFVRVETTFRMEAVWPDLCRAEYDFQSRSFASLAMGFRRPAVWIFEHKDRARWEEVQQPNPGEYGRLALIDLVGCYWLPLLVPLTDPATVVFDARLVTDEPQPMDTVKVHVPDCPVVFTLWFDPKSGRLRQVDYAKTMNRQTVLEMVILDGHKPFDGITAPSQFVHKRNGDPVEEWKVETLEFPEKIDSTRFDPPKVEEKK
jgi:hypothetical protein